jgi:predicted nucleic acid-binding protein
MLVFFDTSAFVKRYIREPGTDEVLDWCDRATEIGLAGIVLPEIISAFCRLRRESLISGEQYGLLKSSLLADIEDAALCDLAPTVMAQTVLALENNTLRAMDAIHIGSAVILKADVFISADRRQCEAAVQVGLRVVSLG